MIWQCFTNTNTINTISYRKLHPCPRVIYVSNVPRLILCSSALMIGDLSVSPNYLYYQYDLYIENCIQIGLILLELKLFSLIFSWKMAAILDFWKFSKLLLPMSLLSSIRSIYRKLHQHRASSSRVIEEQTNTQTHILYPFINSRDL